MSQGTQAIVFNALPLLIVAAAYAVVAGAVLPPLWGGRARSHPLDWATALVFPAIAGAAGIIGATVWYDREPLAGHVWPAFVASLLALIPALLLIARWRERMNVVGGAGRAQEAQREVGALTEISPALARAREPADVCRPLVRRVAELMRVGFVGVAVVTENDAEAVGIYAERDAEPAEWWEAVRVNLREESSGIASAVFDAAPVTVFDIAGSPLVSSRLAIAVGARSGAWIPMIAEERVVGVLTLASTAEKRAFTQDELTLLQAVAAEAGIALERLRAASALASALERERVVAEMTRRVHGETVREDVIRVAGEELEKVGLAGVTIDVDGTAHASDELTQIERFLVETVEREVRSALQTTRLLDENRRRLAQQRALLDAAGVVTSELDVDTVLRRLVGEVTKLLEADAADCYLLDASRGVLRCAAVHGIDEELVGFEFPSDRGLAGEALRTGAPIVGENYETVGATVPHPAYAEFTSALVAPMAWSGETWGVLGVGIKDPARTLGATEIELLEAFASLASLALRNAESFAERTRQARAQRGFYRIASLLGEPLSLAETYDAAAQAAAEALGGDYAAVLVDQRVAGGHELPVAILGLQTPSVVLETGGTVLAAADLASDERFPDAWRSAPCASLLAIRVGSEPDAIVVVLFADPRTFEHDDLELAQHLAGAARGALDRARMFESERSARSLSQHLARTGSLLATELDPDSVIAAVVEEAAALLGADAAALLTLEGEHLVVGAATGDGADAAIGERSPATGFVGGDVVQSREPVAHDDVSGDPSLADADALLAAGHAAFLGVPLLGGFEDPLRGVLAVYCRAPRRWRDEEVQALSALAANASVALANAELYHRVALEREQSVAILANIAEGVVAVDRDGHVVLWNAAAEEITGVPASEALTRTPAQVLQRELESESGGTNRLIAIPRAGKEVWLSLSEAVMRDPSGMVAGRIFAFRDISAEHGVEQMKSDFVSTVSVELRTPLTSIYGFAQTLLRGDIAFTEEERRTFLEFIARESERLTEIVDALLDVAALDTGDLPMALTPTDVREIVRDVVDAAERANENGHRFVAAVDGDELAAEADPDKLRQVLDQLLSNAVKYSPAGGTVTVAARRSGDSVEMSVSDEGAGIPLSERERIFTKFYKAGDGQARGTGLGLFIAQGLVREMGGHMWVDSEEGRGSRFAFELPLAHG
ncbi:MAG TPA: GAF domain-containing protein [Gaiellaceae bacterium]|nr:GAF domain-containing protein [Gaiellaceae bacterium]